MPHTYQPYSVELENLNLFSNRKKYLIPEDKFIYCCLNSSQKINPLIFNSWLNILEVNELLDSAKRTEAADDKERKATIG